MIKLKIRNVFIEDENGWNSVDHYDYERIEDEPFYGLKEYNKEKWNDGKVYEFNTLKELQEFVDTLDLEWTDDFDEHHNGQWDWYEIDNDLYIDKEEDNLMILRIDCHREWRD